MITNREKRFIEEKVREIAESDKTTDTAKIAGKHNALVLFSDMGGAYCLNSNGAIFSVSWDDLNTIRYEVDARIRNLVLFQGSRKFPELAPLIPKRTQFDVVCPSCKGTGVSAIAQDNDINSIVCYCGGLGWVPFQECHETPEQN